MENTIYIKWSDLHISREETRSTVIDELTLAGLLDGEASVVNSYLREFGIVFTRENANYPHIMVFGVEIIKEQK